MMSFVREKKWTRVGLSVVRRWPDNASAVSEKWREQKMSGNLSPEIGTSLMSPVWKRQKSVRRREQRRSASPN